VSVDAPTSDDKTDDPLVGRTIADRYRVLGTIGRGGMGAVYRVEHLMLKKELALKFLHPELGRLDEVMRRFEREAEAAARLDHPNIVGVTDFGRTSDGMLFLAMELLQGQSLTDLIRPNGSDGRPIPVERALHIERQILRALDHAHASGVIHRDLKPDNVMLIERDGEPDIVKLLDFGIAKMSAQSDGGKSETLTQAGIVFGTPEYLSPEQAMGEEADQRADVYSAGIVLYEMLTGRRPFDAQSKVAIVSMHLTQKAMPVTRAAPDANIPPALERIVERAMAKKRDERYASAQAFLHALDEPYRLSQSRPVVTPPSPLGRAFAAVGARIGDGWRFLVRRSRDAGVPFPRAFAAAGVLLATALVALLVFSRRTDRKARPAPRAIAEDVARAESLLAHGELEPARAALTQLLSTHPDVARVRYLLGNLDDAQGERERALDDYHDAIRLDPAFAADAALLANVRAMLDRRGDVAGDAVNLLANDVGKPALADLAGCVKSCKDDRTRRLAAAAVTKLGGSVALPDDAHKVDADAADPRAATLDKLRTGKNCRERRAAALELIASGDKRYIDSLRAARERRGGFLGLEEINGCMRRDLDGAIRKWEAEK
jgi:tRNA A-37 threonylcarbamoyl transferase component Bud32